MKKTIILRNSGIKQQALSIVMNLPVSEINPVCLTIGELSRNLEQNSLLWPLLDCFAKQLPWAVNGVLGHLTAENWKDILSAAFKQEAQQMALGLNGGFVFLGQRTSQMGKKEFSEFIEFILATGADKGVNFEMGKAE